MKQELVICAAVVALAGCAGNNPQTREEFVKTRSAGVPFNMVDTHVANRRFEDVVGSLRQKAQECLNVDVTMKRTQGGITAMNATDEYRTNVRVAGPNRAELTTQFEMSKGQVALQKRPEGGFYERAVDIERASPRTTKLTYYGSSRDSGKKVWGAIKAWSDGNAAACP
jgi:hypothetical protein